MLNTDTRQTLRAWAALAAAVLLACSLLPASVAAQELAPYGTAKTHMKEYPVIDAVFDVN